MIRLAVIGLGAVTKNIHLPAYRLLKDRLALVAGCDVDPATRDAMEKTGLFHKIYDSPEEMLDKATPDVVSVCTPPFFHHRQCLDALEHGCHVFCEKPLVETLAHADEIILASSRCKRSVVVNSQFPKMNMYTAAKKQIDSPEFGRLLFLNA